MYIYKYISTIENNRFRFSVCAHDHSLVENILSVHPAVEFGQFDRHDDTRNEKQAADTQTKPERVLQHTHTHTRIL